MRKPASKKLTVFGLVILLSNTCFGQFSLQGYAANAGGGTLSGGTFTTEVALGSFPGIPLGGEFSIYPGLVAFNLETASIAVRVEDPSGGLITDTVNGYLLKVTPSGNYDTLEAVIGSPSQFSFSSVFVGDFLVNVSSDPSKYVSTYNGDEILWENVDEIRLANDSTIAIRILQVPAELPPNQAGGTVSGTIETELVNSRGRILSRRRRDAGRICGLQKEVSGTFELVAYTKTDADGYFEFTNLTPGNYQFFIDVPGIPLDQAATTTFQLEEGQENSDKFTVQALIKETGIEVTIDEVEEVIAAVAEPAVEINVYPNPANDLLVIGFNKRGTGKLNLEIRDTNGRLTHQDEVSQGLNSKLIPVSNYHRGLYFLKITDSISKESTIHKILLE